MQIYEKSTRNENAEPCDDFYEYVCGLYAHTHIYIYIYIYFYCYCYCYLVESFHPIQELR